MSIINSNVFFSSIRLYCGACLGWLLLEFISALATVTVCSLATSFSLDRIGSGAAPRLQFSSGLARLNVGRWPVAECMMTKRNLIAGFRRATN